MKKNIYIIFGIFFIFTFNKAYSQYYYENQEKGNHYLGFMVSPANEYGLSYKYYPKNMGIQFAFIPIHNIKNTDVRFGTAGLLTLKDVKHYDAKIYMELGSAVLFKKNTTKLNLRIGPAVQFDRDDFCINLMFGYGMYDLTDEALISIAGEIGVYYRF